MLVYRALDPIASRGPRRALRILTHEMLMAATMITRASYASTLYLHMAPSTGRTPSLLGHTVDEPLPPESDDEVGSLL